MGTNDFASLNEGTSRPDNIKVIGTECGVSTTTLLNIISLIHFCALRKVRLGSCGNLPSNKSHVAGIMTCFMDPQLHSISVLGNSYINASKNINHVENQIKDMTREQKISFAENLFVELALENGEFATEDRIRKL